eukprot:Sspe_Gene.7866::Locus_2671_Transcript_2_2_Confidence_0.667_Length_2805::g.7866::m.7866
MERPVTGSSGDTSAEILRLRLQLREARMREQELSGKNDLTSYQQLRQTQWLCQELEKQLEGTSTPPTYPVVVQTGPSDNGSQLLDAPVFAPQAHHRQIPSPASPDSILPPPHKPSVASSSLDLSGTWWLVSTEHGASQSTKYPIAVSHNTTTGELSGKAEIDSMVFAVRGHFAANNAFLTICWTQDCNSSLQLRRREGGGEYDDGIIILEGTYANHYDSTHGSAVVKVLRQHSALEASKPPSPAPLAQGCRVLDLVSRQRCVLEAPYEGDNAVLRGSWWLKGDDGVNRLRTEKEFRVMLPSEYHTPPRTPPRPQHSTVGQTPSPERLQHDLAVYHLSSPSLAPRAPPMGTTSDEPHWRYDAQETQHRSPSAERTEQVVAQCGGQRHATWRSASASPEVRRQSPPAPPPRPPEHPSEASFGASPLRTYPTTAVWTTETTAPPRRHSPPSAPTPERDDELLLRLLRAEQERDQYKKRAEEAEGRAQVMARQLMLERKKAKDAAVDKDPNGVKPSFGAIADNTLASVAAILGRAVSQPRRGDEHHPQTADTPSTPPASGGAPQKGPPEPVASQLPAHPSQPVPHPSQPMPHPSHPLSSYETQTHTASSTSSQHVPPSKPSSTPQGPCQQSGHHPMQTPSQPPSQPSHASPVSHPSVTLPSLNLRSAGPPASPEPVLHEPCRSPSIPRSMSPHGMSSAPPVVASPPCGGTPSAPPPSEAQSGHVSGPVTPFSSGPRPPSPQHFVPITPHHEPPPYTTPEAHTTIPQALGSSVPVAHPVLHTHRVETDPSQQLEHPHPPHPQQQPRYDPQQQPLQEPVPSLHPLRKHEVLPQPAPSSQPCPSQPPLLQRPNGVQHHDSKGDTVTPAQQSTQHVSTGGHPTQQTASQVAPSDAAPQPQPTAQPTLVPQHATEPAAPLTSAQTQPTSA